MAEPIYILMQKIDNVVRPTAATWSLTEAEQLYGKGLIEDYVLLNVGEMPPSLTGKLPPPEHHDPLHKEVRHLTNNVNQLGEGVKKLQERLQNQLLRKKK